MNTTVHIIFKLTFWGFYNRCQTMEYWFTSKLICAGFLEKADRDFWLLFWFYMYIILLHTCFFSFWFSVRSLYSSKNIFISLGSYIEWISTLSFMIQFITIFSLFLSNSKGYYSIIYIILENIAFGFLICIYCFLSLIHALFYNLFLPEFEALYVACFLIIFGCIVRLFGID